MLCVKDIVYEYVWEHILHFILFVTEIILFDEMKHATNIMLCSLTQGIINVTLL